MTCLVTNDLPAAQLGSVTRNASLPLFAILIQQSSNLFFKYIFQSNLSNVHQQTHISKKVGVFIIYKYMNISIYIYIYIYTYYLLVYSLPTQQTPRPPVTHQLVSSNRPATLESAHWSHVWSSKFPTIRPAAALPHSSLEGGENFAAEKKKTNFAVFFFWKGYSSRK